jgi:Spy/CpxP family protein refolding chaperone
MAWSHHHMVGYLEHGGATRNEQRMRAMQHALDLTAQQRVTIAAILDRQAPERRRLMGEMMRQCGDSARSHKSKVDAEIRAVLNPDQQVRFDQLAKRQAERLFQGGPAGPNQY